MPKFTLPQILKKSLSTVILLTNLFIPILASSTFFINDSALAQEMLVNEINLAFPIVTKDGVGLETKEISENVWVFDGVLKSTDNIRYSWKNVDLNTKYVNNPALNAGYLEIYKNDDTTPDNFLLTYGSSPLQLNQIKDFLVAGDNQLLIRFINSNGQVGAKVIVRFKYEIDPNQPKINIIKPSRMVLTPENNYDVVVNLENFALESISSNNPNRGQLRLYLNQVTSQNLLDTFSFSSVISNNLTQLNFNTADLALLQKSLKDDLNAKFIFVLTKTNGELLPYQAEIPVITNYNNTLDVGLPRVTIIDPDKNRTDLNVDGYRKFSLQIDNFEILESFTSGPNSENQGYLQIFIDNSPVSTLYGKKEFTLFDLNQQDLSDGPHVIKVQLVNKDFTKLEPETSDSIEIIYVKEEEQEPEVNSVNWRIYAIVSLAIALVGVVGWFVFKS